MAVGTAQIRQSYEYVRKQSLALCCNLSAEDMLAQSMPDASPSKWHLAHTTWFFDTFILQPHLPRYKPFNTQFAYLFNSYYETAGERHARPQRGLLTRPSLGEVLDYRSYVDKHMMILLESEETGTSIELLKLTEIGLHHEMQHQELLLTDILHLFSHNPLGPAVFETSSSNRLKASALEMTMIASDGGMINVGAEAEGFSYDCERPKHPIYLSPHALGNRLITNAEWLEFMADKGYEQPLLWMSDGWACAQKNQWQAPLYWRETGGAWQQFGLDGWKALDPHAPVCHVSYFEADAYARWADKRLPREHELECAAQNSRSEVDNIDANFVEQKQWRPQSAKPEVQGIQQLGGEVWEWTQSAYSAYPKFKAEQGALGEYNGKFMVNQFVLKGGSCVTPKMQMRDSYRNFFYPHHRWQFSGLRLAEDL